MLFFFFGFTFFRYCHGFIDRNGVDSYCEELVFIFNECLTDAPIRTLSRFDSIAPHNALVSVCVREEVKDRRHTVFFPLLLSFFGFYFCLKGLYQIVL